MVASVLPEFMLFPFISDLFVNDDDDDFTGSRRYLLWTAVIWQHVTSTGRG
jgi:hypothetical protein